MQSFNIPLEIVDIVDDTQQIEIFCPDVVNPGTYFNCVADIPRGTQLTAKVAMTDDVDAAMPPDETLVMPVPGESILGLIRMIFELCRWRRSRM